MLLVHGVRLLGLDQEAGAVDAAAPALPIDPARPQLEDPQR